MNRRASETARVAWCIGIATAIAAPAQAEEPAPEPPADEASGAPDPSGPPGEPHPAAEPPPEPPPVEITVAGTRVSRTAGSAHVIGNRTLERYEYDDAHAIVQTVPGVYVRTEDGFGLRPNIGMRGAASDRSKKVTLLEDGVLIGPAPYSAPAAYYFPVITRMTQLRVIKGPSAITQGPQTIGGAIDMITRPVPSQDSGQIDVAGGEYAYGKIHGWAGTRTDRMGFLVEGVHLRTDGFKELPGGEDTGFYRNEWVVKGIYDLSPTGRTPHDVSVKASYSDELSNESYLGLTDEDFRKNPFRRYAASKLDQMRWHRTAFAVTHRIEPIPRLKIETTAYRNDLSRTWRKVNHFQNASVYDVLTRPDDPQHAILVGVLRGELDSSSSLETLFVGPNQRSFVSHGLQTRVNWETETGPLAHRLEYGLRLHYDRVERLHSEEGFALVGGELVPTVPTAVTARNEAWTEAVAFHAADAVTFHGLTVTPGVRVELLRSSLLNRNPSPGQQPEQRGSTQAVLPGVGVYQAFTDAFGALAGVYRGFSPPAPGDDSTEPELSVNYEAGARYTDEPASAQLIGFYNDYSNLTDICTQSSNCSAADLDRQYDAGSARIYGLEAHAAHDVPVGPVKLPLSLTYTLTLTELRQSVDSDVGSFGSFESGDEIPYVPRHQAHASAGVQGKRAGAYAAVTYVSSMREQAGQGTVADEPHTDEQITLDAGATFKATPWLELYSNVRNVFDAHYLVSRRPYGARPNAPRWVQAGVKARF